MSQNRVGGTIALKINGEIHNAKGAFTYNLGRPKRDAVVGHDRVHGFKEIPQVPFIEGEITDRLALDLESLVQGVDLTVILELANGKVISLRNAWFAGDGNVQTEEGNITARFEGMSADEVR